MKRLVMALGMFVLQNLCVIAAQAQIPYGDDIRHRIVARWLQAAQDNDTATLDYYLTYGINVNVQDDDGQTALMKAAEYGCRDVAERLIDQKALLDLQDWCCNTALINACVNGRRAIVELLIAAKARLMLRNGLGGTALIEAAAFGQAAVVRLLIPAMKAVYEANADLDTSHMDIDVLRQLMLRELVNPLDVQDYEGRTALMEAALRGYTEIVKLLIDAGADTLVKDNEGCTVQMLVRKRYLKNKNEVVAALLGETVQPAPKKRRVIYQRKSKTNI